MTPDWRVRSGDVELAVYHWGAPTDSSAKPVVVMVHGYPDCARVWQKTAEILSKDFHVVAYDVRGTGESSVPKTVKDYEIPVLMRDLEAVLDATVPGRRVHLVAHDWGSMQCWEGVTTEPLQSRIASYTTITGPCLDHVGFWLRERMKRGFGQLAKQLRMSWYMGAYQIPGMASLMWRRIDQIGWPTLMRKLDGTTAEPTPSQGKDGRNGSNLYRANILRHLFRPQERRTDVPVQLVVPTRDPFANPDLYSELPRWAPNLWRRDIDAGHWVPLSHPEQLAELVSEFVRFIESGDEPAALCSARVAAASPTPATVETAEARRTS